MIAEKRIERLRQFTTGERGPYDGVTDDIACVLEALAVCKATQEDTARLDWLEELYSTTNSERHSPWTKFMKLVCEVGFRKAVDISRKP